MPANIATIEQLSVLFDITVRHIQRLTEQGVLIRAQDEEGKTIRGRYELVRNVRGYCAYLREQARLDDTGQSVYTQLRNQKLASETEVAALKLKLYKRKLHRTEDVEFVMTTMLTALKARLLSIPSRITRLLIGKIQFQEIYDLIYREIELALRELAEYDPNSFEARNDEYLALAGAEVQNGNGDAEHQPEEDTERE
jgi:phage terminase Nu1 subunit (DNA packaging protein)